MRHSVDPRQINLFDAFAGVFAPHARKRLDNGWPAVVRAVLLELMPAKALGEHFHPTHGRPTQELDALAALLFLQETFDWTNPETVDAVLFRSDVQFALNREPGVDGLCERTLERDRQQFIDDDLAAQTMHDVTGRLVALLDLDVSRQRLDSTHVFSNMATFGRTRLPVPGRKGETLAEEPAAASPGVNAPPRRLSIDDFAHDERTGTVDACPAGKIPLRVIDDAPTQTTTIEMKAADCQACPFFAACPMQRQGQRYKLSDTDKQRRLDERRREQQTAPFRERYAKRAGQESTNSGRKRRQGLGYLRVAGWNLLHAMKSASLMAKVRAILAQRGLGGRFFAFQLRWLRQVRTVRRWPATKRQQFMLRPT